MRSKECPTLLNPRTLLLVVALDILILVIWLIGTARNAFVVIGAALVAFALGR